jgi:RNA polymerase sigma factor (sigma-70 family)
MTGEQAAQNEGLSQVIEGERRRLLAFIRSRVPDEIDAEDLVQDVFYELLEAYRFMTPIAHAGAWMMQVARNRITDLFRGGRVESIEMSGPAHLLEEVLPSPDAGPDALYARSVLLGEIGIALSELPASQREVFVAHEVEGLSFAEISQQTGVSVNTLLSRKHYAVTRLRKRLQHVFEESGYERKNKK